MSQNTAITHSALLLLILSMSGCAMFRSDPAPAPVPIAEPEATDEAVPMEQETILATETIGEEAETVNTLQFEAIGIAFLEASEPISETTSVVSEQFIEAKGYGFPSPTATNSIQKRVTATEAAQYRALANLAEKHLGVEVSRKAQTVNMAFDREEVTVNLSGNLKGVSEVERSYDEKAEVATVSLKMALEIEKKPEPKPTPEQRKVRAEAAARIHATALLREKIGVAYVEQNIRIEGLEMSHQEARIHVEGLLKGVQFSEIRWTSERICEVTATLEVDQNPLEKIKQDTSDASSQAVKAKADQ